MRKAILAALLVIIISVLSGCGSGGGSVQVTTPTGVAQILSDPTYDGYIAHDPVSGAFTVTQGNTQSEFAGIDLVSGTEYRTFLDFPLGGAGGVPANAVISSAILDIVIQSISPQPVVGTIPIRVDLVSFQPPTLIGTDFDRNSQPPPATTTISPPISQGDLGNHVSIDVTSLMAEAQRLGLVNFQVRIMEDLGIVSPGFIEINDTTGVNRGTLAPVLQVTYF
jgi:hypothetical protein